MRLCPDVAHNRQSLLVFSQSSVSRLIGVLVMLDLVAVPSEVWLYSWDRGFQPPCGHEYSSFVLVGCCVGSGLCDGLITHTGESYRL